MEKTGGRGRDRERPCFLPVFTFSVVFPQINPTQASSTWTEPERKTKGQKGGEEKLLEGKGQENNKWSTKGPG